MFNIPLANSGFIELRKGAEGTVVLDAVAVDEGNTRRETTLILEKDETNQLIQDLMEVSREKW